MDSQDKLAVKKALYNICLSIFRGQPMKHTGQKAILCEKKISVNKIIVFLFWSIFILPPFLGLILMLLGFVFMEKWIYEEIHYQNPEAFTRVEELKVLDFEINTPTSLSFSEIQIIKGLNLAFQTVDHNRFLYCLKQAQNSSHLSKWNFIEWLDLMTPKYNKVMRIFTRD